MKSPLRKRLPRELKGELGKYLVVFLLMVATIGFVSGFLVADGSMLKAYNEGFAKYNIENGNFRVKEYRADNVQQKHHTFLQKSETGQQSLSYERKSSKEGGRDGNRPYVCG